MMTISDIIEIIVVCALIFFPLGYLARHSLRRIRDTLRLFFAKPRYVKPAGTLRRTEKSEDNQKMTQFTQNTAIPSSLWQYWRGLSGWNFYFLVKFGLLWAGYLNFHPLLNLVFAAFLLMPIPRYNTCIACATGLPCRSACFCSGMTHSLLAGKHNEPGFAGGGVQYRLFNRPCPHALLTGR